MPRSFLVWFLGCISLRPFLLSFWWSCIFLRTIVVVIVAVSYHFSAVSHQGSYWWRYPRYQWLADCHSYSFRTLLDHACGGFALGVDVVAFLQNLELVYQLELEFYFLLSYLCAIYSWWPLGQYFFRSTSTNSLMLLLMSIGSLLRIFDVDVRMFLSDICSFCKKALQDIYMLFFHNSSDFDIQHFEVCIYFTVCFSIASVMINFV